MKNKIKIPKELLVTIDVNNTINGGVSQLGFDVENQKEGYQIRVNAPGVDADGLQVEIVKNRIFVFHTLPVFGARVEDEEELFSPRVLAKMTVPSDVDVENISARYDDDEHSLLVFMPYNHLHDDFRKSVEIDRW